jgi:hypothetical protein
MTKNALILLLTILLGRILKRLVMMNTQEDSPINLNAKFVVNGLILRDKKNVGFVVGWSVNIVSMKMKVAVIVDIERG